MHKKLVVAERGGGRRLANMAGAARSVGAARARRCRQAGFRTYAEGGRPPRLEYAATGLPAWKRGQLGQVGNEAAPTVATSAGVRLVTFVPFPA